MSPQNFHPCFPRSCSVTEKLFIYKEHDPRWCIAHTDCRVMWMAESYLGSTINMWMCKSNIYVNVAYNSTTVSKSPCFSLFLFYATFANLLIFLWLFPPLLNFHIYFVQPGALIFIIIHFYASPARVLSVKF